MARIFFIFVAFIFASCSKEKARGPTLIFGACSSSTNQMFVDVNNAASFVQNFNAVCFKTNGSGQTLNLPPILIGAPVPAHTKQTFTIDGTADFPIQSDNHIGCVGREGTIGAFLMTCSST